HPRALATLRPPRGREWLVVAFSGWVGGLTHIFLDGFTHDDRSGWAVALFPALKQHVWVGWFRMPFHDVLQNLSSLVLGVAALVAWNRMASRHPAPAHASGAPSPERAARQAWLAVAVAISGTCGALVVLAMAWSMP